MMRLKGISHKIYIRIWNENSLVVKGNVMILNNTDVAIYRIKVKTIKRKYELFFFFFRLTLKIPFDIALNP